MGSAVKAVTKPISKIPVVGNIVNSAGSFLQGDVLDPLRGKVNTPTGYNPDATAFKNTGRQAELQEVLRSRALGLKEDPTSVAQMQLQNATNRNIQQIAGQAAGQRSNQALAMRQAMRAQADVNQQAANQAAQLRAQEMADAQNMYTQDLVREQTSKQNLEGMRSGIAGATQQLQFQANLNKQQGTKDLINQGAQAAMSLFSDKNLKKDIKNINPKEAEAFISKLKAKKFKYKEPNGEPYQEGEITGIMAQDAEKSKLGKEMVKESPEGKQIDIKKALPATMAAVAEIMKRIKKLEGQE